MLHNGYSVSCQRITRCTHTFAKPIAFVDEYVSYNYWMKTLLWIKTLL